MKNDDRFVRNDRRFFVFLIKVNAIFVFSFYLG